MSEHLADASLNATTSAADRTINSDRPVTSKPRGICKYYNTDRGCYAGRQCKFLHGEAERLTPFDKNKICRFHAAGYCRHGDQCWFRHVDPSKVASSITTKDLADEEAHLCSICYENPVKFGLLSGCSHVFCISCIKNWRGNDGKPDDIVEAGTTKKCPMCRAPSRFVTPSSYFYPEGHPKKVEVIERYKASMSRVKCKYFEKSRPEKRFCPFGKDCFYKHENSDGTPYVFEHGASYYMERRRSRRWRDNLALGVWDSDSDDEFETMLYTISQVFGGSQDLRTALRAVATAFAIDSLPLPYGVEDHNEDGPNEDAENHDESIILNNTPGVDRYDAERDEPSLPVSELPFEDNAVETSLDIDENTDPTRHAIFNSDLDPTIPEFVPSHQLRLQPLPRTPSPSPSHRLDRLRPLPQGPNPLFHDEQDVQAGTESRDFHDLDALPEVEEYQWPVDPIISERFQDFLRELGDRPGRTPEHLNVGGQVDSPLHLASLLRDSPATQGDSPDVAPSSSDITSPTPSSEQHLITPADTQEAASESVFVQDCEPPFLTDGRGRVVWSNTTSSRGRESRRGRAVSSSAMRLPHAKSNSDVLLPNDCCDGASCHHSPVQSSSGLPQPRLVRQWSFPSVATGSALEEARSAEFLTDGRGRVVFAANKQSH